MARAGQVYKLLAVFQDGASDSGNANNKDGKGQYAQLLGDNQQVCLSNFTFSYFFYCPQKNISCNVRYLVS